MLSHAVITVTESGALHVTLDGIDVPPPDGEAWTRATFGRLLDALTRDRTVTVGIEVQESDGSAFTDVIRAADHTRSGTPGAPSEDDRVTRAKRDGTRRPDQIEVTGTGFMPGEDVAVAVIISHIDATTTGHARTLLDRDRIRPLLSHRGGEIVLLGRISGTIHVRPLS